LHEISASFFSCLPFARYILPETLILARQLDAVREKQLMYIGVIDEAMVASSADNTMESSNGSSRSGIDRKALVQRHNPLVQQIDPFAALSVGNGTFAFTADVTGLQTFAEDYRKDFPLCTCAHWAWHTTPARPGIHEQHFRYKKYTAHGRDIGYATDPEGQEELFDWLRKNPHRLHLGQIGLVLKHSDGSEGNSRDLMSIHQMLDLWTGSLDSQFQFAGQSVRVRTCCHPALDAMAVRIESSLVEDGGLTVRFAFPYGSAEVDMADWNSPERHETKCDIKQRADFVRTLDGDKYFASLQWLDGRFMQTAEHEFVLTGGNSTRLEFVMLFAPRPNADALPSFDQTRSASADHWKQFWTSGGAVDLSASSDPRASELERRIILSQYNTALHCAGNMPPPETGLLFNSWYGKSHLEMHWWHGVHFAAWNRMELFERSLGFYHRIFPSAKEIAARQGYQGVRWPKMIGPEGRDSPSSIGPLLIWQQPHPIYYAELCYRRRPSEETLRHWQQIVFETADFMADYAALDGDRYVLGPPLKSVPENTEARLTRNPTFELAYWRFGLETAQRWRHRLGLAPDPKWSKVLARLSPLPKHDDLYLMMEGQTDTYAKWNWEHPSLLGCLGMLEGDSVDVEIMRATLRKVLDVWQWDKCWGWDFPLAAMTAARLGEGELAVRALMIDSVKNRYLANGHVYQGPGLTAYLPANGALLTAIAIMANIPGGFPRDGNWCVKSEGFGSIL
jgi:protein-glucosylgalactosylhydroxylysine glucosidase